MQEEVWKPIKGFEGLYEISNTGKVKSFHKKEPFLLTPKKNNRGYLWVELKNITNISHSQIHRLVAETFLENPNKYPVVNHKDENPLNNNVSNLEWCTKSYNRRYSLMLHPERNKVRRCRPYNLSCVEKTRDGFFTYPHILQLDMQGNVIKEWECPSAIVRELGYNNWSITQTCRGIRKQAYGYKWAFKE